MQRILSRHTLWRGFSSIPGSADTYAIRQRMVDSGFSKQQATLLTRYLAERVHKAGKLHRSKLLLKSQFENETYLYQAALQDLRSELTTERKTDATSISLKLASCFREVDRLKQNFVENIHNLRSEAQLELNGRKQDVSEDRRRDEMRVQEITNGIIVGVSDLKTEIEMMKLNLIWRHTSVASIVVLLFTLAGLQLIKSDKTGTKSGYDDLLPPASSPFSADP